WKASGRRLEVGWHPCLTLDRPVLPAREVPSLVRPDGTFWPLGKFVRRLLRGAFRAEEIHAELTAQCHRFTRLMSHPPTTVNSHHHVQVFSPIGRILLDVLSKYHPRPYVRRVIEPWSMLAAVPGARVKRSLLSLLGKRNAKMQILQGLPGNDCLAGVTDPPCLKETAFLTRWLSRVPGQVLELTCHPGHHDETLLGRDATEADGQLQRRVDEFGLLSAPSFREACRRLQFRRIAPRDLLDASRAGAAHAA